jgi:uracil-DNA glycosylase
MGLRTKLTPKAGTGLRLLRSDRGANSAAVLIPPNATLENLRTAAQACRACELWQRGTQTVFGEGKKTARVMFVGEIPGDREDLAGRPFVGPAGQLLDRALTAAGIDRQDTYVTNVVKHFSWEPRGKRRLHKKPRASEIRACRPWLEAEISLVKPNVLVCLGATAAQALLGKTFSVSQKRGAFVSSDWAPHVMATVHPSSLLRLPEGADRETEMARFVKDLQAIRLRALTH